MKILSDSDESPLFVYSSWGRIALGAFVLVCILPLMIFGLITDPISTLLYWPFYGGIGVGLYFIIRFLTYPVRSGKFYNDRFEVNGWKFKGEYRYDQVHHVGLIKLNRFSKMVTIDVKGLSENIVLYSNPSNFTSLNTDLYRWLTMKTSANRLGVSNP